MRISRISLGGYQAVPVEEFDVGPFTVLEEQRRQDLRARSDFQRACSITSSPTENNASVTCVQTLVATEPCTSIWTGGWSSMMLSWL